MGLHLKPLKGSSTPWAVGGELSRRQSQLIQSPRAGFLVLITLNMQDNLITKFNSATGISLAELNLMRSALQPRLSRLSLPVPPVGLDWAGLRVLLLD